MSCLTLIFKPTLSDTMFFAFLYLFKFLFFVNFVFVCLCVFVSFSYSVKGYVSISFR